MIAKFHPLAEDELAEGAAFYELRSVGLGRAFITEIQRSLQRIVEYPEAAPVVRSGIRRHPLRRFPYSVLYSVEDDAIHVWALMHHSREPNYWTRRRPTR